MSLSVGESVGVVVDAAQFPTHVLSSRPSLCSELIRQLRARARVPAQFSAVVQS